jgi:hypothetical protein
LNLGWRVSLVSVLAPDNNTRLRIDFQEIPIEGHEEDDLAVRAGADAVVWG